MLVVEDDLRLAALYRDFLHEHGFRASIEVDGGKAVKRVFDDRPDLVLLDIMLPGTDGLTICRELRPRYRGPILMVTARGEEVDQIVGLELGADDYLVKPVTPRLLLTRIRSLLRRVSGSPARPPGERLVLGSLVVDLTNRAVRLDGGDIDLTTAEFELLAFLARRAGTCVSRDDLSEMHGGGDYDGLSRTIDIRVSRLRRKLGDDGRRPKRIKNVRGVGYLLTVT